MPVEDSALLPDTTFSMLQGGTRGQLRVLTLNIFSANNGADHVRISQQIELIRACDADVVCLQEAWQAEVVERFRRAFPGFHAVNAGQLVQKPASPVRHVASATALFFAVAFFALPRLLLPALSTAPAAPLSVAAGVLLFGAWALVTRVSMPPPVVALWGVTLYLAGVERGCAWLATLFAALIAVFWPEIFLGWLHATGLAPIATCIAHGDPFASHPGAATPRPACVHARAYREQGYRMLGAGGPALCVLDMRSDSD
eukprot:g4253.t1